MFFTVQKKDYLVEDFIKTNTYLTACFIIKNYPIRSTEKSLDLYIKQNYRISLKDMCFRLLTKLTFSKTDTGNNILLFNDPKDDAIARLITYGNGVVPGCKILQLALNQH